MTVHSFAFALLPCVVFLASSLKIIPLTIVDALRAFAWVSICNLGLLIVLTLWRGLRAAAATLSWFYIILAFYTGVLMLLSAAVPSVAESTWALTYVTVCGVAALWLGRPPKGKDERHKMFNVVSLTLVVVSLAMTVLQTSPPGTRKWQDAAAAILASAPVPTSTPADAPDIYYVVLDGLGRADVLRDLYGLDITEEMNGLRALGWTLSSRSSANYPQTYLALASALNGSYLDPIARTMGTSSDRRPLHELIQQSAPISALKQRGYRFSLIGAKMAVTGRHELADVCTCDWPGLNEYENALLGITPFRMLPLYGTTFASQYRTVLGAFDALERIPRDDRPNLVFAHIVAPHPPFVVDEYGRPTRREGPVAYNDGDHYQGTTEEYRHGYRAQTRFVLRRLLAFAQKLEARRRPAVVVVHGDHGPGSAYSHRALERTNLAERFSIFLGMKLGDPTRKIPDDLSPVNVFRVIFNARFGSSLPLLPNRSFYATWDEPYRFTEIPVQ
jgi:hypothetical protein